MKNHILQLVATAVVLTTNLSAQPAASANASYRQGLAAEKAGDPNAARAAYEQALRLDPNHADATFRIGQLKLRHDAIARHGRQAAFNGVMLNEVRLDDASLRDALDALAMMMETESEGKIAPNFVIQDADAKLSDARISLQLRKITSGAVFDYILKMANARARHDEFAIVILPN